jgi:hypothetical protein
VQAESRFLTEQVLEGLWGDLLEDTASVLRQLS